MGRNVNRDKVIVARLTGVAAAVGHVRRATVTKGLAEAGIKPGSERAAAVLTHALAMYVGPRRDPSSWWYHDAAAFLIAAGADVLAAARIRAAQPGG